MRKLKVAIVGCGRISEVYKHSFTKLQEEVEVVYAIDTKLERAEAFAAEFPGCIASVDFRDCFNKGIDVIHLATPHYTHAAIAIEAMKNGINVLTEKPMAISLKDGQEMIKVSEEEGVSLGVIFQTRYVKGCMEIKKLIEEGKLGEIIAARSYLSWKREDSYYETSDWKGTWDKEGGGVLIDQAIHSIDRVQWLVGSKAKWVEGTISNRRHPKVKVEDTAEALVTFENNCAYHLFATNCYSYDAPIEIEIVGEKGKAGLKQDLAWVQLQGEDYYEIPDCGDGIIVGPSYWGSSHIIQISDYYTSLREKRSHYIDGREGIKALELVLSIYESAEKGRKIILGGA